MEFSLSNPIQVMDKKKGAYEDVGVVSVGFVGKKGLKALKGLQDVIFKTFQETPNSGSSGEKKEKKDTDITTDDLLTMLDMTGNSEKVFDSVMDALKDFGNIGEQKLTETIQNEMAIDDLDALYQEVLKNFLLPKIILRMNSLTR